MDYKIASDTYNAPFTTLHRLSRKSNSTPVQVIQTKLRWSAALPQELEEQWVDYLLLMENNFNGLSRSDVKTMMAYQLVTLNENKTPSPKMKKALNDNSQI